jgi:protein-S-isoprenylcysteine O-methyltransferase Ste14
MTTRADREDRAFSMLAWIVTSAGVAGVFFVVPILRGASLAELYFGGPGFGLLLVVGLAAVWAAWSYGWFHWTSLRNRQRRASKTFHGWRLIRLAALCSVPFIPLAMTVVVGMSAMTGD